MMWILIPVGIIVLCAIVSFLIQLGNIPENPEDRD